MLGSSRSRKTNASNLDDIERFVEFAVEFVDLADVPPDLPSRTSC